MKNVKTIVPANPGFYVLEQCVNPADKDAYDGYGRVAIVAWAVTSGGDNDDDAEYRVDAVTMDPWAVTHFILDPDGTVTRQCDQTWPSIDAWLADAKIWKRNP